MKITPQSGNFVLRPWHLRDYINLAFNANSFNISKHLRDLFPFPYSENDAIQFISSVLDKKGLTTDFAIEIDGKAVGGIGFYVMDDIYRVNAEIGYWIGESYQRKGVLSEALPLVCQYIFNNTEVLQIVAPVISGNKGSMRLLLKSGFVEKAVLPNYLIKNGEIKDEHLFVLNRNVATKNPHGSTVGKFPSRQSL